MKGIVFTEFLDLVEDAYGLELKHKIISVSKLPNEGAYTSVGNYDFHELVTLAGHLSAATGTPLRDLLVVFGERIFQRFVRDYGQFFVNAKSTFDFLSHIQDYIHVEVRKLYPDAELPTFQYPAMDGRHLVMEYRSPRPFAAFAEGLVRATVKHFGEDISVSVEDLSGGAGTSARFDLRKNA